MLPECLAHRRGPARGLHSSLSPPPRDAASPSPADPLLAISLPLPPPCVPSFLPPPALEVSSARPPFLPAPFTEWLFRASSSAGKSLVCPELRGCCPHGLRGWPQPESDTLRKSRGQALVWGWVRLEVPAEPSGGQEEERGGCLRIHARGQHASQPPASLWVSRLWIEAPSYRGEN